MKIESWEEIAKKRQVELDEIWVRVRQAEAALGVKSDALREIIKIASHVSMDCDHASTFRRMSTKCVRCIAEVALESDPIAMAEKLADGKKGGKSNGSRPKI